MKFEGYGELEWLDPEEFRKNGWRYIGTLFGEDGELYEVVVLKHDDRPDDVRYTIA